MNVNKFVGSKLKKFRTNRGWNQTQLAEKVGIKQNTISSYENGNLEMGYDTLYKIAEVLEVSVDDFFPATAKGDNTLQKINEVADAKDLTIDDLELIQNIAEKMKKLSKEEREKLNNNIQFALDFFENNK